MEANVKKPTPTAARNRRVFGQFESLEFRFPWTEAISNMLNWLCWDTGAVLGISKTSLVRKVVEECVEAHAQGVKPVEWQRRVEELIRREIQENTGDERYAPRPAGLVAPLEAVRRAQFFNESFLNKEFQVVWSLASDRYISAFVGQYFDIQRGGTWATQYEGHLYEHNTGIGRTAPDCLAFNAERGVLVAPEQKLGGSKNADQILKYAWLFSELVAREFVPADTRFYLLFVGEQSLMSDWPMRVDHEIQRLEKSGKAPHLVTTENQTAARGLEINSVSWPEVIAFNEMFLGTLTTEQQVELRLVADFNASLRTKASIHLEPKTNT
jgi:hypothetical protein